MKFIVTTTSYIPNTSLVRYMPQADHAHGITIKEYVARYKTMSVYQVLRKAGWDTNGLPVELEVEKQLNIRGKEQIEEYGIENFIQKCKESVFEYENEWKQFTNAPILLAIG